MISLRLFMFNYWLMLLVLVFGITLSNSATAQNIRVTGGFLSDSIKIGEETAFYLSASYTSDLTVLFPDSAYNFAPFEYIKKQYFPTETRSGISFDSTVYFLTSFELDSLQLLSLPVYLVNAQDCTSYLSNQDSLRILHQVAHVPDTIPTSQLPLKMNTAYHKVNFQFNYMIALIIGAALILIVVVVWILFGKRIARYLKAKNLLKRHRAFISSYNQVTSQVQQTFSSATTEHAVALWKKYMEQLEARPFTKLTTRETLPLLPDENLGRSLRNIDRAIYGNATTVAESLTYLKNFADQRFTKKLEEVKHGK